MNRSFVALTLALSWTGVLCFADEVPSSTKIKPAIVLIKSHMAKNQPLDKNPLEGVELQTLASRGYLYYYDAVGALLTSKTKPDSEKIVYLEKALRSLELSKQSPYYDFEHQEEIHTDILKQKIDLLFKARNKIGLLQAIESLPLDEQKDPHFILYYGEALFATQQQTAFLRFAKQNLTLFKDSKLIEEVLEETPNWDSLLAQINSDPKGPEKLKAASPGSFDNSKANILKNTKQALGYLGKNSYFSDASKIFKSASSLYFSLYKKDKISGPEKSYVRAFQKDMYTFAPTLIDDLITAHWKKRDLEVAEKLSVSYLSQYQGHSVYPKVLFNLARLQEDHRNYDKALKSYQKLLTQSDDVVYSEYARFRSAWVVYLSKKNKRAAELFTQYLERYPEGKYASTCEYFLLKLDAANSKTSVASDKVRKFIDTYPLNLYSLILMDEWHLGDDFLLNSFSKTASLQNLQKSYNIFRADIATLNRLKAYNELVAFDLRAEASTVLKGFPLDEHNDLLMVYLAAEYEKLDNANGEEATLIKILNALPQLRPQLPWKGLFPAYHIDLIKQQLAEQHSDVSPYLILSIVRQESAFDPTCHSPANAVGLMQLTPGTAQETAQALHVKSYSLDNEGDNLKLGIKNFTDLLKRFNNRLDYALSAYNAGEYATQLWVDLHGQLEPIAFIESIPYQETRMYVKNILRNYAIYRMLYDKRPAPLISFNFANEKAG